MKTFKDYYKFPLKPMAGCEKLKVLTANNQMAFDWCLYWAPQVMQELIDTINGTFHRIYPCHYNNDSCCIIDDILNKPLLRIRGWGHLTGVGGLNLSEDKAKAIQDDFGNYIVNQLNK